MWLPKKYAHYFLESTLVVEHILYFSTHIIVLYQCPYSLVVLFPPFSETPFLRMVAYYLFLRCYIHVFHSKKYVYFCFFHFFFTPLLGKIAIFSGNTSVLRLGYAITLLRQLHKLLTGLSGLAVRKTVCTATMATPSKTTRLRKKTMAHIFKIFTSKRLSRSPIIRYLSPPKKKAYLASIPTQTPFAYFLLKAIRLPRACKHFCKCLMAICGQLRRKMDYSAKRLLIRFSDVSPCPKRQPLNIFL